MRLKYWHKNKDTQPHTLLPTNTLKKTLGLEPVILCYNHHPWQSFGTDPERDSSLLCPQSPVDLSPCLCTLSPQRSPHTSKTQARHTFTLTETTRGKVMREKKRQTKSFPLQLLCVSWSLEADRQLNNTCHDPIFSLSPLPEGNKHFGGGTACTSTVRVYVCAYLANTTEPFMSVASIHTVINRFFPHQKIII